MPTRLHRQRANLASNPTEYGGRREDARKLGEMLTHAVGVEPLALQVLGGDSVITYKGRASADKAARVLASTGWNTRVYKSVDEHKASKGKKPTVFTVWRVGARLKKGNPSIQTGVLEGYSTRKGSGVIQSPKKRGPYSVQFMGLDQQATTKQIDRLANARKWLRARLGVLRKAKNPVTIADAFSGETLAGVAPTQNPSNYWIYQNKYQKGMKGQVYSDLTLEEVRERIFQAVNAGSESVPGRVYKGWFESGRFKKDKKAASVLSDSAYRTWRDAYLSLEENPARNPSSAQDRQSADTLYEDFHGKAPTRTTEVRTIVKQHAHLAQLGMLTELQVLLLTGERVAIPFPEEGRSVVTLASSPDGKQLYFEGGDQAMDLGSLKMDSAKWIRDSMVLGVLYQLTYRTVKGFDKFQLTDYFHDLGEETKIQPLLIYDYNSRLIAVAGGQYEIIPEGIVN